MLVKLADAVVSGIHDSSYSMWEVCVYSNVCVTKDYKAFFKIQVKGVPESYYISKIA